MAERMGFEPMVLAADRWFQDQFHKPLGHLSTVAAARMQVLLYKSGGLSASVQTFNFIPHQRGAHGVVSLAAEQAVSAPKQRTAVKVKAAIRFMVKPF